MAFLTQSSSLGKAAGRDPGATLTYAPLAPRTAPTTGFLILVGAAASVSTARFVKSADYDAIALNTKLPGDPRRIQVERFTFEAPDLTDLTIDTLQGLTLPNDTPLPGVGALQLNILGGPRGGCGSHDQPGKPCRRRGHVSCAASAGDWSGCRPHARSFAIGGPHRCGEQYRSRGSVDHQGNAAL